LQWAFLLPTQTPTGMITLGYEYLLLLLTWGRGTALLAASWLQAADGGGA